MADRAHQQSEAETLNIETNLDELAIAPRRSSTRLAIVVSLSAIIVGAAAAAVYFGSALLKSDSFAELFPRAAAVPIADDPAVSAALSDIRSLQQQNAAALHENGANLQQNTVMLQQGATTLASLRQTFTDQQADLKRISDQLSSLIARVDALQNGVTPLTTSSIQPKPRARVASRKKTSRLPKPFGPVSVGGAPLGPAPVQGSGAG